MYSIESVIFSTQKVGYMKKFCSLISTCILAFIVFTLLKADIFGATCCEHNSANFACSEKIYLKSENILVVEHGIYYLINKEALPIMILHCDQNGIFVDLTELSRNPEVTDQCMNGHKIYHWDCLGCAHWFCPFRCKCYSPW